MRIRRFLKFILPYGVVDLVRNRRRLRNLGRREHGFDFSLLCRQLFANRVSAFFGLDVIVSAVVLFVFIATERRRAAMPHIWLPVIGTLIIGVSFGLPLFLYLRQIRLDETPT
jgi:hypothetical protein